MAGRRQFYSRRVGNCWFTDEELELLPKITRRHWQRINYCYAMRHEPKKKGVPITREHFAIAFVILDWCCRYPNEDKQQPNNRIMALWKWLYERGHVQQQWDDSRWAAIRNTLVDLGFIEEIDSTYWFHKEGDKKGKAMQWELKEEYMLDWFFPSQEKEEVSIQESYPSVIWFRWRPECLMPQEFDYLEWTEEKLTEFILQHGPC